MAEQVLREQAAELGPPAVMGSGGVVSRGTLAVTIGNMLEFYDFITYSFFAIQIGHTFFPLAKPVCQPDAVAGDVWRGLHYPADWRNWLIGSYSDRAGRRPAMILSFVMMGSAIIVLALTPPTNPSASPRRSSRSSRAWFRDFRSAVKSGRPRPI